MAAELDWHAWHRQYDDPASSLSGRLAVVRERLADRLRARAGAPTRLISMCAGDGRDTLPVLAAVAPQTTALLVELDPALGAAARRTATDLALRHVEVRCVDAGCSDAYAGGAAADLLLACGVFGNLPDRDVAVTVAALPTLLAPGAVVIWTRGRGGVSARSEDPEPSDAIRDLLRANDFEELSFERPPVALSCRGASVRRSARDVAPGAPLVPVRAGRDGVILRCAGRAEPRVGQDYPSPSDSR